MSQNNSQRAKKPKKENFDLSKLTCNAHVEIPPFELQNVVSTFSLGLSGINLRKIANKFSFIEFNPQTFAAGTVRIRDPRTTCLCFQSGNMVCTGGRTELESRLAARKYVRIFQNAGLPACFSNFRIQNIVASANVGFTIKLREMARDFGPYSTFEPQLFPGLIFRSINPKLVFLCFRSGKVVITGAKNKTQIEQTYSSMYTNVLIKYRDVAGSTSSSSVYRNACRAELDTL